MNSKLMIDEYICIYDKLSMYDKRGFTIAIEDPILYNKYMYDYTAFLNKYNNINEKLLDNKTSIIIDIVKMKKHGLYFKPKVLILNKMMQISEEMILVILDDIDLCAQLRGLYIPYYVRFEKQIRYCIDNKFFETLVKFCITFQSVVKYNNDKDETIIDYICQNFRDAYMDDICISIIDILGIKCINDCKNDCSTLMHAISIGHKNTALKLINEYKNECMISRIVSGCTALTFACENKNMEDVALKLLDTFSEDCMLDSLDNEFNMTALELAKKHGMNRVVDKIEQIKIKNK
jgi:hypothetical protein